MKVKSWQWDVVLWVLASPVLAVVGIVRAVCWLRAVAATLRHAITCRTCGAQIPLVGFWRCRCGFTYQGALQRFCPICGSFPAMVRCRCGATEKLTQWT